MIRSLLIYISFPILLFSCSLFDDEYYVENCADHNFLKATTYDKNLMEIDIERAINKIEKYEKKINYIKSTNIPIRCVGGLEDPDILVDSDICFAHPDSLLCKEPTQYHQQFLGCITKEEKIESNIFVINTFIRDINADIKWLKEDLNTHVGFQNKFSSLSLQNKLQNKTDAITYKITLNEKKRMSYEDYFSNCSTILKEDPITFKAKWK